MNNPKHKNLVCNWCHKKGHIRADCWTRKKKQQDANVIELSEGDEDKCDVLSVIDSLIGNKVHGLLNLDVHIISVPIGRYSPYTLQFKGEMSSWEILLQSR